MKNVIAAIDVSVNDSYKTANTVNREGFKAWEMSDYDKLEQLCMTGTMQNTFYASTKELVNEAIPIFQNAKAEDLAKAIVKGRNEGYVRTSNIMGLIYLSQKDPVLFRSVFNKVIKTGNDMEDFINMCHKVRGFGRSIKSAIASWLTENVNPYYALKYRKQVADAIRISKFKGEDPIYKFALAHYLGSVVKSRDKFNKPVMLDEKDIKPAYKKYPQLKGYQAAVEALKEGETDKLIELINKHKLDVMSLIGNGKVEDKVWTALGNQMPVMMTLKYLNKLDRSGVFNKDISMIKEKLTVENLQKAKVFPFRLYIAYTHMTNQKVGNHLVDVLNKYIESFDWGVFNKYSWCIAPDVSGSMTNAVTGSDLTPAIVAGMFSGFFYKGLDESILVPWGTNAYKYNTPKADSVVTHINNIARAGGGGTNMEAPVNHLINTKTKVDNFMLITDSMEWGSGWLTSWKEYKRKINHNARAFMIRVDSNGTQPMSDNDAKKYGIYQIFGWSDNVVKYIDYILSKNTK